MNILIRADASSEIGTGHIMRCFALAQFFKDSGDTVCIVTHKQTQQSLLQRILNENIAVHVLHEDSDDASETIKYAGIFKADWIITDGYQFTTDYQRILKSSYKLMCIDDIASCHYVSDVVLNQNLNAENIFHYSAELYTRFLLGAQYTLLRREFRQPQLQKTVRKICQNLLITIGGADPENATLKILQALNLINCEISVRIILGAAYKFNSSLERFLKDFRHQAEVLLNVENMVAQMVWADVAIAGAGSTCWELAAVRVPMIVGVIAENQVPIAEELVKRRAAVSLRWIREADILTMAQQIEEMIHSYEMRKSLVENSISISDGEGVARVREVLLSF